MTENLPRGNFGPGPTTLPSISWFEFLLDDKLLENHLQLENPDPSPVQLIVQFLQQADVHQNSNVSSKDQVPPISISNGQGADQIKFEEMDSKPIFKENKKVKALRLLALKVAAYLNWDLKKLLKGVPLVMLYTLLNELLKESMNCELDSLSDKIMDFEEVSEQAIFALQLFYRWCLLSVVKDSFPTRPTRSFLQVQGQPDSHVVLAGANEMLIRNLKEKTSVSVANLEKCINCGRVIRMPTMKSIVLPGEDSEQGEIQWEEGHSLETDEYTCQLFYDIGSFYFYQEAYSQAYVMFKRATELFSNLKSPVYCKIDEHRLRGYHTGCKSLRGYIDPGDVKKDSLYEQAEFSRKNNFKDIVQILITDNLKQELTSMYRADLEEEIANRDDGSNNLYIQVTICNVVRGVMEGKALVSLLADVLESADKEIIDFLLMVLSKALTGASNSQKANIKCFIWHLMDLSPAGSRFNISVMKDPLRTNFTEQELFEMSAVANENVDGQGFMDMVDDDMTTTCSSYPTSRDNTGNSLLRRDSSISMGNAEHQLLYMYDPDVMHHLIVDLCQKHGRSPAYIMSLNDKSYPPLFAYIDLDHMWKVPKDMHNIVTNLPPTTDQALVYLLIGKANHCMDVKIFERARQLLNVADRVVAELSYTLSKHIRWHILLADLMQYFLNESLSDGTTLQDLVKKTKTCITSVRLGQDIQPSKMVLEHCAAFLLNIRDWQYLTNMDNTGSGHIELCRLLACVCKELPSVKNARKPARDIVEAIKNIFSTNVQHKRTNSGRDSALHRDSGIAILTKEAFIEFLKKIKEPVVLTTLVSCITKFYNLIRNDISCEISSDYIALWPTTLPNSNAINPSAVEEAVLVLMQHVLRVNPAQASWLRTQADIHYANGQYSPAMKYFMEAGVVASDFFSSAVPKSIYDDQVYRRMLKCCSYLQCHTQVAVLCQFLDEVDYTTAFKSLHERNVYDAMDAYYSCIWDISILEFLTHLHAKKGEMDKKQSAMKALSQLDLNSNNPEDIVQRAVQMRKRKFLRSLAKQYL